MAESSMLTLPSGIVTLLLTDIVGSTAMWEALPGPMADALARHDQLISETVRRHSGIVLKSRGEGDSTFSVFARASDAATSALEIQRRLAAETWAGGLIVQVRMALNTGETVERDGDYFGTVVNRTARIRSIAGPSQILLSQSTAEVIADLLDDVTLTELGPQALAGLSRPERVFQLRDGSGGQVGHVGHVEQVRSGGVPAALRSMTQDNFVGRDAELSSLAAMWERAAYGSRSVAFLAGEPGIGKTRLSAELATRVHQDGGLVLFGRCDQDLGAAYQPFVEALSAFAATRPAAQLRVEVGADAHHLARLVPAIADLVADEMSEQGDNEADRYRLFEATARMLEQIGARQPVLVILDDLHWATKPTLLMLRHLVRSLHEARVMLLGTYRDTDVDAGHPLTDLLADLRRESNVERVALTGISAEDVGAFVARSAGKEMDQQELTLARTVHAGTDGNPFFMREVLRHLVASGAITRRDGVWVTDTTAVEEAGLPESVREVIGHRVGALSADANKALVVASVIGSHFSLGLLERIPDAADDADRLLDALDEAVHARVLVEGSLGYTFAHALIRQTLYDSISATRRARLHLRVGEAMEQASDRSFYLDALALHYAEAGALGDPVKAAEYALAAGQAALSSLAYEGAIDLLARGLATLEPATDAARELKAELLLTLAESRQSAGDDLGSRETALEAAQVARALGSGPLLARAAYALTYENALGIQNLELIKICEEALQALENGEDPYLQARLLASLGRVQAFVSRDRARTAHLLSRARHIAETLTPRQRAEVVMICFPALIGWEPPGQLLAISDAIVQSARELGDRRLLAETLMPSFQAKLGNADIAGFRADLAEFGELASQIRWPFLLAVRDMARAMEASLAGRFDEAAELAASMLARAPDDPRLTSFSYAIMLVLRWETGEQDGMRGFLEVINEQRPDITAVGGYLARLLAFEGDEVAARSQITKMMADNFSIVPRDAVWLTGLSILGEAVAMLGTDEQRRTMVSTLGPNSGELAYIGRVTALGAVDRFLGMLRTSLGQYAEAEALFDAALRLETSLQSAPLIARTQTAYAQMLRARDDGNDRARARELLDLSLQAAQRLGMIGLVQQVESLLSLP